MGKLLDNISNVMEEFSTENIKSQKIKALEHKKHLITENTGRQEHENTESTESLNYEKVEGAKTISGESMSDEKKQAEATEKSSSGENKKGKKGLAVIVVVVIVVIVGLGLYNYFTSDNGSAGEEPESIISLDQIKADFENKEKKLKSDAIPPESYV